MEIILLENVANLGGLGDRVNVKPGYGRNYLVPHGKAVPATAINIAEFESRRAELQKEAEFYKHIQQKHVNWASTTLAKPVEDFYNIFRHWAHQMFYERSAALPKCFRASLLLLNKKDSL